GPAALLVGDLHLEREPRGLEPARGGAERLLPVGMRALVENARLAHSRGNRIEYVEGGYKRLATRGQPGGDRSLLGTREETAATRPPRHPYPAGGPLDLPIERGRHALARAAARVSPGRRRAGLRGAGVEGSPLPARHVSPPRRSGGARGGPRLGGDDSRAAGVRGVAAHRPSRGSVPARPGGAAPRVVSGDGRAARGRRRAARHRAGDRGHGPRPRAVSSRIVAVL